MFGYNDMNTNVPNPFVTQGNIVLSGAGRKKRTYQMKPIDWARMRKAEEEYEPKYELHGSGMDGAGWMDDIKKGYNKTKSAVKSETGQKIKKALMEDKDFMKEFNKAKKQLKDYTDGKRKTKPGKAAMSILEQAGVISKIENEFKGGVNRLKKAKRWRDFSEETAYKGIDLADYGYRKAKTAMNPVSRTVSGWFGGAQGGAKRGPSMWITHVKDFAQKNNIPYKEALKAAGPSYRAIKNKM
jgi:hypothetical protein